MSNLDNINEVDPGSLPSGVRSFLGHMHTYRSAALKQNTNLAYYRSNQLVKNAIQSYKLDEGQVSEIGHHAMKLTRAKRGSCLLKHGNI